jgi:opacity protein-like surface antigen
MSSHKSEYRIRLSLATAMVAAFLAGQAKAADDEPNPFAHRNVLTARVALPFVGGDDGHGFTILGLSLGQRFLNLVEIEAGVSAQTLIVLDNGNTLVVRAGLSPSVLNPRPSGTHWNLRIPLLAGFSYYKGSDSKDEGPGPPGTTFVYVYHFDTGLDATYWGKSGVGFNMRILVNLGTARERQTQQDPYFSSSSSYSGLVGGSFMIGISFAGL